MVAFRVWNPRKVSASPARMSIAIVRSASKPATVKVCASKVHHLVAVPHVASIATNSHGRAHQSDRSLYQYARTVLEAPHPF